MDDKRILKKYYDAGFVFTSEDKGEFCEECRKVRKEGINACDKHKTLPQTVWEA